MLPCRAGPKGADSCGEIGSFAKTSSGLAQAPAAVGQTDRTDATGSGRASDPLERTRNPFDRTAFLASTAHGRQPGQPRSTAPYRSADGCRLCLGRELDLADLTGLL